MTTDATIWAPPHRGMPPLDMTGRQISMFEFWPMWLFYLPLYPYIGWLMLRYGGIMTPTLANPSILCGGLVGESKSYVLAMAVKSTPEWVAPFIAWDRQLIPAADEVDSVERLLAEAGLSLPIVAKPDLGCRGVGVRLIKTKTELANYIAAYPPGERMVLQRYIAHDAEAGIFYVREPGAERGQILSITLKYFPHVFGDGTSTLGELIHADPRAGRIAHIYLARHQERLKWVPAAGEPVRLAFAGSHSRGTIFRNGTHLATPAMLDRFDAIAKALPEFYFGRFDVRFSDIDSLQAGENFTIMEINGVGAESTHIWDRNMTLSKAYKSLMTQYHLMFHIGATNRRRGFKAQRFTRLLHMWQHESTLVERYPGTQ